MFLLGNNLGENKDDLVKLNWFRGDTPMGTNARPFTLQTVIKAKMIMRLRNIKEQLGAFQPIHNETIDELLRRVNIPLRAISRRARPEWYSRPAADDKSWTAHCHDIMQLMIHSMTQISRWGVGNVRRTSEDPLRHQISRASCTSPSWPWSATTTQHYDRFAKHRCTCAPRAYLTTCS